MSLRSNVGGVTQRRALVEDVSTFNTLLNASGGPALFRATFGQYNYSMMVENSVAALVSVVETEEKCLGFLVVNDSPTVSLENDVFMATVEALRDTAGLSDCKASNTLFLNFFLVDETSRYDSDQVSFDLVRNAFALCPLADYIVWLCPSKVRLGFWMEDHFAHVNVAVPEGGVIPQGVKILYTHRSTFMPKLLVRPARVEDNDDLLPILYNSNPHVVAGQGEFFLADLIQSQDERNKFLVGVHKNIPSGMLALSLDVNVALITKVFDIDAFPDLVIPKVKRPPPPPLFISLLGEIRAVPKHVMRDMVENMNCLFIDAEDVLSKQVSTEEKAGEGENGESEEEVETRAARAAMDALKAHILYLLRSSSQPGQEATATAPTACLVSGFPRNDAEAHEMAQGYMSFDLVLELGDESHGDDDASQQGGGEGEDDFLRRHLESVEALRSFSSAQAELRCPWYRVALGADSGTKDKDFYAAVFGIVDQRAKEVETIMLLDDQEPPKANAFAVTVFCVGDEYESRGEDLLRVAFEEQPSLDYCLYMVANSARPSQLTSSMLQVKTRVGVTFDQTLYLVHRDAFLAHDLLRVERLAAGEMLEAMERFVSPLAAGPPKSLLLKACHDSLVQNDMELKDNPPEVCFAVLMGNDVVGVVTTSRQALSNDDVTWIRTNYHIDEFVNYDRHRLRAQAQITNMVMNPVFSKWTRHVLREVMRKYFKTILYFFVSGTATPPVEILDEMVPVAPRRRMQTAPGFAALPLIERPSAGGAGVGSPLFYLTKRQLTEPRAVVPKKVVVVGGGSSSYAVLEKLLFTPHLNLTNIQLVLELPPVAFNIAGGVGSSVAGDAAAAAELPFCSRCSGILSYEDADDPTMTELSAMGVAHRVSIVRGRLTDIDRANKAIVISDEVISEYDVLVVASTTKDVSTKRFPTTAGTHPAQCAFRGMFGLGDPASDLAALEWVRRQNPDRLPIVVYGDNFETLGAIGSLLEQGVDPSRITAVISVIKIPDLGHPYVVESAMRNLRASGVYLRLGYEIVDVQLTKFGSIESVLLKSIVAEADPDDLASGSGSGAGGGGGAAAAEIPMLSLPCFSLLCAGAKYCDSDVFAAINDCGIVFDGGVVVDQVSACC